MNKITWIICVCKKTPTFSFFLQALITLFLSLFGFKLFGQACGASQALSTNQQQQISAVVTQLDTALKNETLFQIDSLSAELKTIYSTQSGIPDAVETYYALVSNINWLNVTNAVLLSRALVASDSMVYVDLWKSAKGMKPSLYQPHSLFLRASAEIASGLFKIADKESDATRKALYQLWATRALDSLATMQLPCGAFPFPDLRAYGDPVFSSIIQNYLNWCGADSVNVVQNGWIIDDKGTGEFKFDAGVIANAYYEAYQYTGNTTYKNIVIAIGNYLKQLKLNQNYNYNTFASLGLTRAFQLTNDSSYLNRAIITLRYAVYPGQVENGRWVDGHNANSRYHSIIIQNIVPTIGLIPSTNNYKNDLEKMAYKAVKNLVNYSCSCNSATGFRWLIKSYLLDSSIIPSTLKDSITDLIGRHINQSAINGKYLDVPTMGEYLELLDVMNGLNESVSPTESRVNVFPNPTNDLVNIKIDNYKIESNKIYNSIGVLVQENNKSEFSISGMSAGIYYIKTTTDKSIFITKIIKQ